MVVTLEETKLLFKIDGDEEDALITNFIFTAEEICEEYIRYPLSEFEEVPKVSKASSLYAVANMYEKEKEHILRKMKVVVFQRQLCNEINTQNLRRESW
jgi:uncharacterized phage protein (predicted DNA packaging)